MTSYHFVKTLRLRFYTVFQIVVRSPGEICVGLIHDGSTFAIGLESDPVDMQLSSLAITR